MAVISGHDSNVGCRFVGQLRRLRLVVHVIIVVVVVVSIVVIFVVVVIVVVVVVDNDDNDMKYGTKPWQLANKSATDVTIVSIDNSQQEGRSLRNWPTNLLPTLLSDLLSAPGGGHMLL